MRESINVYDWINSVLIDVIPKFVYTCKKWFAKFLPRRVTCLIFRYAIFDYYIVLRKMLLNSFTFAQQNQSGISQAFLTKEIQIGKKLIERDGQHLRLTSLFMNKATHICNCLIG